MMKKILLHISLIVLISTVSLFAEIGVGGASSIFSSGGGGRALGMGGANVVLANDASAVFWNSAVLDKLPYRTISLMYLSLPEGTSYNFAAMAFPTVDYGSFAIGAFLMTTDNMERRNENGKLLGNFSANQQMYLIGYGKKIKDFLSLGFSLKLVGYNIDEFNSFGAGADLGMRIDFTNNIALALNAQNLLAPKINLDRDSETLPLNLKAGLGFNFPFPAGRHNLAFEVDVDKRKELDPVFHVGGELSLLNSYFLRAGYDVDQINFGGGIRYRIFSLGYAYRSQDFFDIQHRISLDISLGGSIESILMKRQQDRLLAAEQLSEEQRQQEIENSFIAARQFFQSGEYDSAEVYYAKAAALSEDTEGEAKERLSQIEKKKSDELIEQVREGTLAQADSAYTVKIFNNLEAAIKGKEFENAKILLDKYRTDYGSTEEFQRLEADYGTVISKESSRLKSTANRSANEGDLLTAAINYNKVLNLNPNDRSAKQNYKVINDRLAALTALREGIAAYNRGDTLTANLNFQKLLTLNPEDTVAIEMLRLLSPEILDEDITPLDRIRADAMTWKLYLEGIEKFREGKYSDAIVSWEQVLESYPGNPETKKNIEQAKRRLSSTSDE